MANRLEDHLRLRLLINGVFQVKPSSVRVQFAPNNNPVDTLEGLAGKTPGSGRVTITVTAAVHIGGPEFDYFGSSTRGDYVEMQVPFGAQSYIGTGWFDDVEIGQSTGANTEVNFTWTGEFAEPR
jgi:hypothetical protein